MESLSRPPPQHRRKHSTATNTVPLKSPYDDVFVARGGRLHADEYTEIFAGSSSSPPSIPLLDLSGLDERVGSGDFRVSVQDYSSIFGGLRNDDVAVPYQELFAGFTKRAKPSRKSASPLQYSSPLHSSENTKSNGKSVDNHSSLQHSESLRPSESAKRPTDEASNQSVEGGKQQVNISFNRTSQIDSDALDGKTDVAELHSVPGFTFFANGTPQQQKTEDCKPISHSLKREVSRTWSFSADVEDAKGKRGLSSNISHIPDVPHNRSEGNLKLHSSKKPPSSSSPEKPSDGKQTRASDFASKEDSSKKNAVGSWPPLLDEEFDENSVAAASAAALKKAMDQAQESIRIAKMMMERKKEGHRDRYKTRSCDFIKDLDTETKIRRDAYASNENRSAKEYEEADSTFWVDDTCIPPFVQNDAATKAGNVVSSREKVKVAEGCKEEFSRGAKLFTFGFSKNVEISVGEKFELEKHGVAKEQEDEVARGPKLFTSDGNQSEGICHEDKAQLGKNVENAELAKGGDEFATGGGSFSSLFCKGEDIYVGEKVQLEMHEENVETAKVCGEDLAGAAKLVVSNCKSEGVLLHEKVQLDSVESNEFNRETAGFTGLATIAESRTANFGSGEVVNNDSLMLSMNLPPSNLVTVDTFNESLGWGNVNFSDTEPKVLVELAEKPRASHRMQDPVDNVEETEQSETTFYHAKASQDIFEPVERILDTLPSTTQGKVVDEDSENKISLEDEVARISKNNMDEHGRESEECDEMHNGEHWTALESGFIDFTIETSHIIGRELLEQEVIEKEAENVPCGEETEHSDERTFDEEESGVRQEEVHILFERKEPPTEALEEEISCREPSVSPKMEESYKKIETFEPEIDMDPAHESDEPKLPRELGQDSIEERPNGTPEHEASEILMMEENSCTGIQKNEAFWDVEETNSTSGETERSAEDGSFCDFQEVVYDDDDNEAVDSNTLGASPLFSEAQETCAIDSNSGTGHYKKTVNSNVENGTVPDVTEAEIEEDADAEQLFHQGTNELPAADSLHSNTSEGMLLEGKQQNAFEGPSADKADIVTDSKENLSEDEHVFKTADGIYGADYAANNDVEVLSSVPSDGGEQEFNLTDAKPVQEQTSESDQGSESTCSLDNIDQFSVHESEGDAENVKDMTPSKEEMVDEPVVSNEKNYTEEQEGLCSQPQSETEEDKFVGAKITGEKSLNIEKEDLVGNVFVGDKDAKKDVENTERQQRIEAIKRAREQEKDRLVVERAIREARERAFAEARERAARAAAEKAASEARQSRMKEAQKKLDKAPTVRHPSDTASTEAKLRAERAAVERATVEARERALEKALSQKNPAETRTDRNAALKHSFSSSDLESSTCTESARRRQARLERHRRTMERAAKALAEKNMRDILAQKEQAERNRLAESLDAEIKRWASGKEGNLRALLSTLQYILGRDSGWQPISLTEILTTAAVKRAYRKATLYVHPDKLQQRGASIQQKYICEKVFDLLKAAWNMFNSEER